MLNCEFCKSNSLKSIGKVIFLKTECDALMCIECGNVVKNYNPQSQEFMNFYQNIEHDNEVLYNHKLEEQLEYLSQNIDFKKLENVLEIGPGPTGLISKFDSSFNRFSCEIDENAIQSLDRNGIKNFKDLSLIDNDKFDLIILSHVFEHIVDDLDSYLLKLVNLLTDKGLVFIEVPSAQYELMIDKGSLINHYFSEGHKRSSTEKSFELILKRLNIKNFKVKTSSSFLRKIEYKHRFEYSKILLPFVLIRMLGHILQRNLFCLPIIFLALFYIHCLLKIEIYLNLV